MYPGSMLDPRDLDKKVRDLEGAVNCLMNLNHMLSSRIEALEDKLRDKEKEVR